MRVQFKGLALGVGAALAVMFAPPAHATLEVIINGTISGGTVTGGSLFVDQCTTAPVGCAANDTNSAVGALDFSFGAINFTITGSASTSASPVAEISMTTNGNPITAPTTLTIAVSDNGFTTPPVPLSLIQDVSGLATPGGPTANLSAVGYFAASNTDFDTSGTHTGTATATLGSAQGTATSGTISTGTTYSLTEFITANILTSGNAGTSMQINGDLTATGVPEPASVALFGGVLLMTFGALRRKWQHKA